MFSQSGMPAGQMQQLRNQPALFGNMGEMSFGSMFPGRFPADWGRQAPNFHGVLSGGFKRGF